MAYWRLDGDDRLGDIGDRDALVVASLARPSGPQLLACELGRDVDAAGVEVAYEDAVEHLFGAETDGLLRARQLHVDPATRARLVRELATADRLLDDKLRRNASGDDAPDAAAPRARSLGPSPASCAPRPSRGSAVGVAALFDLWRAKRGPSLAASTIRRYGPAVASLDAHTGGRDVRRLTEDDLWE